MARRTKRTSTITEDITISCQVQSMITAAANLLEVAHFLHVLRWVLHGIIHHILLSLQLLPCSDSVRFLIIKRKHLLRLVVMLLLILLLVVELMVIPRRMIITHIIISLSKSI